MGVAQRYNVRPSEIMAIDDSYTAYCFDEACAFIAAKMDNKEQPHFITHYNSFSSLYKQYS